MTTAQESPNGHLPQKGYPQDALFAGNKVLPPPYSFPDAQQQDGSKDSTANSANPGSAASLRRESDAVPAGSCHFPPDGFTPKAAPYRNDDRLADKMANLKLPDRCQFMFSDGRQCTMARSRIHPSLCTYHSEREEQLFGDPGTLVRGRSFDLPELYSACRDLTTAAGVNRALAHVFRLLAQRRISRQEAATFGHLAQLLLRSISAMRQEEPAIRVESSHSAPKDRQPNESSHPHRLQPSSHAEPREIISDSAPLESTAVPQAELKTSIPGAPRPYESMSPLPSSTSDANVSADPCVLENRQARGIDPNSRLINTYEIARHKTVQNQHLQNNGEKQAPNLDGRAAHDECFVAQVVPAAFRRETCGFSHAAPRRARRLRRTWVSRPRRERLRAHGIRRMRSNQVPAAGPIAKVRDVALECGLESY